MRPCVFCEIAAGRAPASPVHTAGDYLAFMDIHPWRPGHVLVIPRRHCQRVGGLDPGERAGLFQLAAEIGEAIRRSAIPCDDLHFLLNDGEAANQTVPHAHMHVIPRVRGDFWRLLRGIAQHSMGPLLRPAPRSVLDKQAAEIQCRL